MPTFGMIVSESELAPKSAQVKAHRDNSWMEPYRDAIKALQSEAPRSRILLNIDPEAGDDVKVIKNNARRVAKSMGVVVSFIKVAGSDTQLGMYIDPDRAPTLNAYDKLKLEAAERGITVTQLKAEKDAEKSGMPTDSVESAGRRGRPRRNDTPELATV